MKEAIQITDAAARKVWELISEEENPNLRLRIYVTGGGCSGMQYGFSFDEEVSEEDTVVRCKVVLETTAGDEDGEGGDAGSVEFLLDPTSLQYLFGAEVDYVKDIKGEQFVIRNPNAKTSCGCGSSFSA